jgi:hypothetical protein
LRMSSHRQYIATISLFIFVAATRLLTFVAAFLRSAYW